jgi:carbon monoxide dehydrogenase subunit G
MKQLEIISKTSKINNTDERIFKFLSDFRNLSRFMPPDVKDWNASEDFCTFSVKGQTIMLNIIEKAPFKLIKITGAEGSPYNFNLWIQLKSLSAYETAARIVVRAGLNMIMRTAIKKPLQQGVDQFAEYLKLLPY